MMNNIVYGIDSVQIIRWYGNDVAVVAGWVKTEGNDEVQILMDENLNWLQCRYLLNDVIKNGKPNCCGFQLYIWLERFEKNVKLIFSAGDAIEEVLVPIVKRFIKNKIKNFVKQENEERKFPFLTFVVSDRMRYCIESIYYNTEINRVSISGWVYAQGGVINISVNDAFDFTWEKRRDVVEAFEGVLEVREKCGFNGNVLLSGEEKNLTIYMEAGEDGKAIINYTMNFLKKYMSSACLKYPKVRLPKVRENDNERELRKKYGRKGGFFKEKEFVIWNYENDLNNLKYQWEEVHIPDGYINKLKKQPLISVICVVKIDENNITIVASLFEQLKNQQYRNYEIIVCGSQSNEKWIQKIYPEARYIRCEEKKREACLTEALKRVKGEWVCFIEQEDLISRCYLSAFVERINENDRAKIIFQDYDIWHGGIPLIKVQRTERFTQDENLDMIFTATCIRKGNMDSFEQIVRFLKKCHKSKIVHDNRITYHYNAIQSLWEKEHTKIIAFYLPQYHVTEENNKWWGEGFTEWRNVKRGIPMFEGHDQPRVPKDLGYYDLVEDKSVQYKQIRMAKKFDIYGFCFYYYWFEGKRLLRKPLDQFLEDKNLDFPFCICWANETWSKRWNGQENEILMQQVHNEYTDVAFIKDVIPLMRDQRYIRIDGKPLLLIYRINLFPEPYKTIRRWKKICSEDGIPDIHVAIVQSFGVIDHRIYGADSSVEFPPHKIMGKLIDETKLLRNEKFVGNIFSYKEIVDNLSVIKKRGYNMITGSMLRWDNTARRMEKADIFAEFEPELFRKWMIRNHYYTKLYNDSDITFVNAWNEWAEGTYLEPDQSYGNTFLEISKEVSSYK